MLNETILGSVWVWTCRLQAWVSGCRNGQKNYNAVPECCKVRFVADGLGAKWGPHVFQGAGMMRIIANSWADISSSV